MFRVLAGCAFFCFSAIFATAADLRPSVQKFFLDPTVNARDAHERDANCDGQLVFHSVRMRWIWLDNLSVIPGDPVHNQPSHISFHTMHWSEDLVGLANETGSSSVPIKPDAPDVFDRADSGLLGLISDGGGGWFAWDFLSAADLSGQTDLEVGRSKREVISVRDAMSALTALVRSESIILSEPIRDRLRQDALLRLGHSGIAALISLNSTPMSAIERWRNRNVAYFGYEQQLDRDPKSPIRDQLRREAVDEQEQIIRQGASEAEADYRIAIWVDKDPDMLFRVPGTPIFVPRYDETINWLNRAMEADPKHVAAIRMKLELLVSQPIPWNKNPPSDSEILGLAEQLRALEPNDPLPAQIIFANRQKVGRVDDFILPELRAAVRPDGVSLDRLQAGTIDLSGEHHVGLDLTNVYVDFVVGHHADFSDAQLALDDRRPARLFSRFFGLGQVDNFTWMGFKLADAKLDRAHIANGSVTVEATDTSFRNIRLETLRVDTTGMRRADFREAQLKSVEFYGDAWQDIDFSGAHFISSSINAATLKRVNFKNADLADTHFANVTFHGIDFSQSDLSHVVFEASAYDCATRFPAGFRPDKAGLIALSNKCRGERTTRNIALSGKCKVPTDRPLLPGTILDGLKCDGNDLPKDLAGVSMRHMKLGFAMRFDDYDLANADLTGVEDNGERFWPGFCESGGGSIVNALLRAKRLDHAKLRGVTLQLFDAAAATVYLSESDLAQSIKRLSSADLDGAILKCGADDKAPGQFYGWRAGWAAANQEQFRLLARLRHARGVIVDASCSH